MKKFGDAVIYVRGGVELNAIVMSDRDGELELAYFDPAIGEMLYRTHGTTSRAFSVNPLTEGGINGWTDDKRRSETLQEQLSSCAEKNVSPIRQIHEAAERYAATTEGKDEALQALANAGPQPPSAADLDAVAEDQKAAEATAE